MHDFTTVVIGALVSGFCLAVAAGQPSDEQTIREIDAAWSQALQNKDLDKVMSNYVEDASFLPPDEPIVQGRTNIREWFARRVKLPGIFGDFRSHDDHGFQIRGHGLRDRHFLGVGQ